MQKLLVFLALAFSGVSLAQTPSEEQVREVTGDKPIPQHLIDSEIELKLKTGPVYNFDGDEWKVVPRSSSRKVQALLNKLRKDLAECQKALDECEKKLAEKDKEIAALKTENAALRQRVSDLEAVDLKPNRLTFQAGMGPDGMEAKQNEAGRRVTAKQAPVYGLSYARRVYEDWSLQGTGVMGGSVNSRTFTGLLGVGRDF